MKGINRHVEKRFLEKDTKFEDETILRIIVKDADEPPVFVLEEFFMEVAEDNLNGSFVGSVSARDPDDIDSPIRYTANPKIWIGLEMDRTGNNSIIWFLMSLKSTPKIVGVGLWVRYI